MFYTIRKKHHSITCTACGAQLCMYVYSLSKIVKFPKSTKNSAVIENDSLQIYQTAAVEVNKSATTALVESFGVISEITSWTAVVAGRAVCNVLLARDDHLHCIECIYRMCITVGTIAAFVPLLACPLQ